MRRVLAGVVGVALGASSTQAGGVVYSGGVNVDFNAASGAGSGQPGVTFAGAGGQAGYWNPLNAPFTNGVGRTLRNLANSADALTLTFTDGTPTATFVSNNALTSGDTELLMDDVLDLGPPGGAKELTIGTFAPGLYRVIVYAWDPSSAADTTSVTVSPASGATGSSVTVGGAMAGANTLTAGVTHADVTLVLTSADAIRVRCSTVAGFGNINGVQVVPMNGVTRLYVESGRAGTAPETGLSWATSFRDLQTALAVAGGMPGVAELWLTNGEYRPDTLLYALNDRNAVFRPRGGLAIYGGFFGHESTLAERTVDPVVGTFISGNLGSEVSTADDAYHLMYAPTAGGTLTLDGLKFQSTKPGTGDIDGSGLHVGGGSVVVRDCLFRFCIGEDAAVVVQGGASAAFTRTTWDRNSSSRTTALRVDGTGSTATLDQCVFLNQFMVASYLGDLIDVIAGANFTMTNSLIHDNCHINAADSGMYMFYVGNATARLDNCTFANNLGGGMYLTPSAGTFVCHNSILWGNRRTIDPAESLEEQQIHPLGAIAGVTFTDSIIEGYAGTRFAGLANLGNDPRFVDPDGADGSPGTSDDNYRLDSRSPARDSAWYGGLLTTAHTFDLDGSPRVVDDPLMPNSGFSSAATPLDRGCYEAQSASTPCPGDIGRAGGLPGADGLRDNNDFIAFINYFFALDPRADLGRAGGLPGSDGHYDNNDFIAYINLFFTPCS